jgi:hypothetical protein
MGRGLGSMLRRFKMALTSTIRPWVITSVIMYVMYMYVIHAFIHTCTQYIHTYKHTHIHIYTQYIPTYIHTFIHTLKRNDTNTVTDGQGEAVHVAAEPSFYFKLSLCECHKRQICNV